MSTTPKTLHQPTTSASHDATWPPVPGLQLMGVALLRVAEIREFLRPALRHTLPSRLLFGLLGPLHGVALPGAFPGSRVPLGVNPGGVRWDWGRIRGIMGRIRVSLLERS